MSEDFNALEMAQMNLNAANVRIATQSALCAQLAAALNAWMVFSNADDPAYKARWEVRGRVDTIAALTAYATMSPDPQWQRVPEGYEIVKLPTEQDLFESIASVEVYYDTVQSSSAREIAQDILKRARGEG